MNPGLCLFAAAKDFGQLAFIVPTWMSKEAYCPGVYLTEEDWPLPVRGWLKLKVLMPSAASVTPVQVMRRFLFASVGCGL